MVTQPNTIARTPAEGCSACDARRLHEPEDWENHPFAGHGYLKETGWTHGLLKLNAVKELGGK